MPVVVQARRYDTTFYKAMGMPAMDELMQRRSETTDRMRGDPGFEGFD
jgi:hypothetical protein